MNRQQVIASIASRDRLIDQAIRKGAIKLPDAIGSYARVVMRKDKRALLAIDNPRAAVAGSADDRNYTMPFRITAVGEDRDADTVEPMGCVKKNYDINPVISFGHFAEYQYPIAKSLSVEPRQTEVISVARFDEHDSDAMLVYDKLKRGFLSAASCAFVPLEAYRRDEVEKASPRSTQVPRGWWFKSWDLTEWAVVSVPSHPGAGVIRDLLDREKSFMSPGLRKAMLPYAAPAKKCWNGWCCQLTAPQPESVPAFARLENLFRTEQAKTVQYARQRGFALGSGSPSPPATMESWNATCDRLFDQLNKSLGTFSGSSGGYSIPNQADAEGPIGSPTYDRYNWATCGCKGCLKVEKCPCSKGCQCLAKKGMETTGPDTTQVGERLLVSEGDVPPDSTKSEDDELVCPHCGADLEPAYKHRGKMPDFCPDCGKPVPADDGDGIPGSDAGGSDNPDTDDINATRYDPYADGDKDKDPRRRYDLPGQPTY